MAATNTQFGISRAQGALVESVESDNSVQIKELIGSNGEVADARPYKQVIEGTVKGHGATTVAPGIGASGDSAVTGGLTIISNVKTGENSQDFATWEYSYKNYPFAGTAQ